MSEIVHAVLLQLRTEAAPADVDAAFAAARRIPDQIEGVREVVAGPDVSVEGLTDGLTHGVIVRFADSAARERYLAHPAHEALGALMGPLIERAVVVDVAV
jgi:hypothetical protein